LAFTQTLMNRGHPIWAGGDPWLSMAESYQDQGYPFGPAGARSLRLPRSLILSYFLPSYFLSSL